MTPTLRRNNAHSQREKTSASLLTVAAALVVGLIVGYNLNMESSLVDQVRQETTTRAHNSLMEISTDESLPEEKQGLSSETTVGNVDKENDANNTIQSPQETKPQQSPLDEQNIHVWVHIPKTGGTSGYKLFMMPLLHNNQSVFPPFMPRSHYGDWTSPGCQGTELAFGGSHCSQSEIRHCLRTHQHLPVFGDVSSDANLHFFTILRDPVERVLSEFFWWRNKPTPAWTPTMRANSGNLTAWVLDETNIAHNRQSLYMLMNEKFPTGGKECIMFSGDRLHDWTVKNYGSIAGSNQAFETTGSALDKVVRIFSSRYAFAAVLDDMELSRNAFQQQWGVEPGEFVSPSHGSKKQAVSTEVKALIRERNHLDAILYSKAVQRLEQTAVQSTEGY